MHDRMHVFSLSIGFQICVVHFCSYLRYFFCLRPKTRLIYERGFAAFAPESQMELDSLQVEAIEDRPLGIARKTPAFLKMIMAFRGHSKKS